LLADNHVPGKGWCQQGHVVVKIKPRKAQQDTIKVSTPPIAETLCLATTDYKTGDDDDDYHHHHHSMYVVQPEHLNLKIITQRCTNTRYVTSAIIIKNQDRCK